MPLPAAHLQSVQAAVKMENAPDLSLRGVRRPTWRPERAARGSALGVQSREGTHDFADDFPVIQLGAARFPRRFAPRNDNRGSIFGRRWCIPTCSCQRRSLSAATDAIGFYHFIDSLYESQALCREGHASPLQRAADARIIQQKQGRAGFGASLFFQLLIPPPAWACRGAYTWSSSRRGGCSHSRCSGTGGPTAACGAGHRYSIPHDPGSPPPS